MTPNEFLVEGVYPNAEILVNEPANRRHAYNLIASIDSLSAHIFDWCLHHNAAYVSKFRNDIEYRQHLSKLNHEFELVRDLAKAQKHVKLDRGTPRVTSAKQVESRALGWDEASWDEALWDGPPQVVVTTDDGSVHVITSVSAAAVKFLEEEMRSLGIT